MSEYSGYLAPYKSAIISSYESGRTPREIAESLYKELGVRSPNAELCRMADWAQIGSFTGLIKVILGLRPKYRAKKRTIEKEKVLTERVVRMSADEKLKEMARFIVSAKLNAEDAYQYLKSAMNLAGLTLVDSNKGVPSLGVLDEPIENLELSTRAYNALKNSGYNLVKDVAQEHRAVLRRVQNLGGGSIAEIEDALSAVGLRLGMVLPVESSPKGS